MKEFINAYLNIIDEAKFENEKFKRFDVYRGIEIYYSYEHIKQRLNERYSKYSFGTIRQLSKVLLKNLLIDPVFINFKLNDFPFVCYFTVSNVWITGRMKNNFGEWRMQVYTLLPNDNPSYSKDHYFKEIKR